MSRKYKFHNPSGIYFISFATVNWIDVFVREIYCNIIINSLAYCRANKSLELYAYCIMPSHVHMVFRSKVSKPSELLRDFKGYTSKKLIRSIANHPKESRKEWILPMLQDAGSNRSNVSICQFWQQHNRPKECWSATVLRQKINYVHMNPVVAGFVNQPWDWKYSSSRNYEQLSTVLEIDLVGFDFFRFIAGLK